MRTATAAIAVLVFAALVGGGVYVLASGSGGDLHATWVSDTARDTRVNHHTPAAGFVDGRPFVFAPISSTADTGRCSLTGIHGENGSVDWNYWIPTDVCISHSVADPTVADYDGDGVREVLAATTEDALMAFDPTDGRVELRVNLSSYGYTKPVVADLTGGPAREIVIVDIKGALSVVEPNGSVAWRRDLGAYTWGQPHVADFDGDGAPELAVGTGQGNVTLFDGNGSVEWKRTTNLSATWSTSGTVDGTPAFAVADSNGRIAVFDGKTGNTVFERDVGAFAAVHAFADGDGDGRTELYVTNRAGELRAIEPATGTTEWTTTLTTEDVQMMPPPSLGDVDGDGAPEIVAPGNDGAISVVDPETGAVTARYERDVAIWTNVRLADLDGDGAEEIYLVFGDGRVVRLGA